MKEGKIKKFLNYLWRAFDIFYIGYFALILIGIAFIFSLGFTKIYDLKVISSSNALIIATALIAVNVALGSMIFSYANNFKDKENKNLVKIGEKFILSSIAFILNLSLMGLTKIGYMDELFKDVSLKNYIVWPFAFFILLLSLVAFAFFIYGLYKLIQFIVKRK